MIYIGVQIDNPWWERQFVSMWEKTIPVTTHKTIEVQLYTQNVIISGTCKVTTKRDHSGFTITVGLLGYTIDFTLYDSRHWDNTNNCYEKYNA